MNPREDTRQPGGPAACLERHMDTPVPRTAAQINLLTGTLNSECNYSFRF